MLVNSNMIDADIEEYCKNNNVKFSKMEYRELIKMFCKKRKPVPAKFSEIIDILDANLESYYCNEIHII